MKPTMQGLDLVGVVAGFIAGVLLLIDGRWAVGLLWIIAACTWARVAVESGRR